MNRRHAVGALFVVCTIGGPLLAAAQTPRKVWRIGALAPGNEKEAVPYVNEILRGLLEAGLAEGKDFTFETRYAEGKNERLTGYAADLVRQNVDVILADSTNGAIAARKATAKIPIVFAGVGGDPIALGFADSLARPGGNMTGMTNFSGDLQPKRLELIKRAIPKLSRLASLTNPTNPYHLEYSRRIRIAADAIGVQWLNAPWDVTEDIDPVFDKITRDGAQALMVSGDVFHIQHAKRIADAAITHRLASIAPFREYANAGVLLSYGTSTFAQYRQISTYLAKILRGAKPGDLPIEQPATFEFVVNLKTAKSLGLTVPGELLLRADKVIE